MDKSQKIEIAEMLTAAWQLLNNQSLEPVTLKMAGRLLEPYGYDVAKVAIEQSIIGGRRLAIADLVGAAKDISGKGYPTAETALARAIEAQDENRTVWLLPEIMEAWTVAEPLNDGKHTYDHSKAFKDAYALAVRRSEAKGSNPTWYVSLGHEAADLRAERLEQANQENWLPIENKNQAVAMIGQIKTETAPIAGSVSEHIAAMKASLGMTNESLAAKQARLDAEMQRKKQNQIDALQKRSTEHESWPDPFDNADQYVALCKQQGRSIPDWYFGEKTA
jgi:hypothetical protein